MTSKQSPVATPPLEGAVTFGLPVVTSVGSSVWSLAVIPSAVVVTSSARVVAGPWVVAGGGGTAPPQDSTGDCSPVQYLYLPFATVALQFDKKGLDLDCRGSDMLQFAVICAQSTTYCSSTTVSHVAGCHTVEKRQDIWCVKGGGVLPHFVLAEKCTFPPRTGLWLVGRNIFGRSFSRANSRKK